MEKLNITPGEWTDNYDTGSWLIKAGEKIVAEVYLNMEFVSNQDEFNAALIAEAGTVANETGLTPRQLLQQRNELLEALLLAGMMCEVKQKQKMYGKDNPAHWTNVITRAIQNAQR